MKDGASKGSAKFLERTSFASWAIGTLQTSPARPEGCLPLAPRSVDAGPSPELLLWLGHDPHVGLRRLPPSRELLLRLGVGNRGHDDDVLTLLPIDRGGHLVLRGELAGIDETQHFVEIAAGAHRIGEHRLDLLVRTDDEDRADGGIIGRPPDLRGAAGLLRPP